MSDDENHRNDGNDDPDVEAQGSGTERSVGDTAEERARELMGTLARVLDDVSLGLSGLEEQLEEVRMHIEGLDEEHRSTSPVLEVADTLGGTLGEMDALVEDREQRDLRRLLAARLAEARSEMNDLRVALEELISTFLDDRASVLVEVASALGLVQADLTRAQGIVTDFDPHILTFPVAISRDRARVIVTAVITEHGYRPVSRGGLLVPGCACGWSAEPTDVMPRGPRIVREDPDALVAADGPRDGVDADDDGDDASGSGGDGDGEEEAGAGLHGLHVADEVLRALGA